MRALLVLLVACAAPPVEAPASDPCALPAGLELAELEPRAANVLVRRSLACADHRHGRISEAEYRRRVAALDAELAGKRLTPRKGVVSRELPNRLIVWASSVIDYSSQYSDPAWSANQILGPPDVYPAYGDHDKAWASQGADDRPEYIEVGFGQPERVSGVEIYETFNPGALDKLELITVKGKRIEIPLGTQPTGGTSSVHSQHHVRCTSEPIASVRVSLDSPRVPGWNELDAIGIVPCTR